MKLKLAAYAETQGQPRGAGNDWPDLATWTGLPKGEAKATTKTTRRIHWARRQLCPFLFS